MYPKFVVVEASRLFGDGLPVESTVFFMIQKLNKAI